MKKLYRASIYHKRFYPRINEFFYRGFYIRFNLSKVTELNGSLFSVNKFNIFSFYTVDHGDRKGGDLHTWGLDKLSQAGIHNFKGHFEIQTFPRVLGHVFNPVSFWYAIEEGVTKAIICEVNNTFGESHNYVLGDSPMERKITTAKEFHVSPFYPVEGEYDFNFMIEDRVSIDLINHSKLQLHTYIKGSEIEWSTKNFLKLFAFYPIYSFIVLFLIHYQALKLFLKKIQFYSKPVKEAKEVTYEHTGKYTESS
jgi:DUF1365 family protein